jgi:hypothetical protein
MAIFMEDCAVTGGGRWVRRNKHGALLLANRFFAAW